MGIEILQNREEVIQALCNLIEKSAKENIEKNGTFNIAVSGGSLVTFLVTGLPKVRTDFSKWKIFFCDERLVPVDNPDSTYGVYKDKLVATQAVPLNENQFVVVKQNVPPEEAARVYEEDIKKYVPSNPLPQFDMLLLGMGPDGHTCSLFPAHKLLEEKTRWVAAITDSPKPPPSRITLTFPVINNAKICVFAISGKDKADMIKRIHVNKEDLPAGRVKPIFGEVHWLVDQEAASDINVN